MASSTSMFLGDDEIDEEKKQFVREYFQKLDPCRGDDDALHKVYRDVASIYDKAMRIITLPAEYMSNQVIKVSSNPKDLDAVRILDVATGTGLLVEALYAKGFRALEGLDMSEDMLKFAEKKGIFKKLHHMPMTEKPNPMIEADTYDVITCCGCLVEGHMPMESLFEMIRITKKGGHLVLAIYDPNYTLNYMEVLGKAIREKKVNLLSMDLVPYKREYRLDFAFVRCHVVVLEVL